MLGNGIYDFLSSSERAKGQKTERKIKSSLDMVKKKLFLQETTIISTREENPSNFFSDLTPFLIGNASQLKKHFTNESKNYCR